MIIPLIEVKETKNKGKGVFVAQFIPKGTITCFECDKCKILLENEISKLDEKAKKMYIYHKKNGMFLYPCDETKYINHSCNSNTLNYKELFDIAVRDIKKGEEMTFDYRVFYDYPEDEFACNCNEDNCCGTVKYIHPAPKELQAFWNERLNSAMNLINKVNQPLKNELLKKSEEYRGYFK
jgi:hypothetical protein